MPSHLCQTPNLFVLGARRSGTASLAHYMGQHPAIGFTKPRDPHFFVKDDLYSHGMNYYLQTFCRTSTQCHWFGDATSAHFAYPDVVGPRLRVAYGDAPLKFVVLLREPVARAWSHYLARVQHGCEKRDFATALAQESDEPAHSEARYFAEGRYMHLIRAWQQYYPAENFLFLLSEDLAANPWAQVRHVFMWLGVDTTMPINVNEQINKARYSPNLRMVEFINHPPNWIRFIGKRVWPESWQRRRVRLKVRERLQTGYPTLPMLDPAIAHRLREQYREDVLALSKHLGRYLSHWLPEEATSATASPVARPVH